MKMCVIWEGGGGGGGRLNRGIHRQVKTLVVCWCAGTQTKGKGENVRGRKNEKRIISFEIKPRKTKKQNDDKRIRLAQNSALPGVLGKAMASRMFSTPVT